MDDDIRRCRPTALQGKILRRGQVALRASAPRGGMNYRKAYAGVGGPHYQIGIADCTWRDRGGARRPRDACQPGRRQANYDASYGKVHRNGDLLVNGPRCWPRRAGWRGERLRRPGSILKETLGRRHLQVERPTCGARGEEIAGRRRVARRRIADRGRSPWPAPLANIVR